MTHTKEELQKMLAEMRKLSDSFYYAAARIGCHPFIEFTGLMNEYIKLCELALENGQDFTETSIHGDSSSLPAAGYHAAYVGEKLACIYGTTFSSPSLKKAFMREMFGDTKA